MLNENIFTKITNYQKIEDIEKDPIMQELVEKIGELMHSKNSIGKGMTAEVFISKTNPDVCYKIIHSDGEYNFRHSVYDEGDLLAKAFKVSQNSKVKIPKPYYSIVTKLENGQEFEVLAMERIHGSSLKDIITDNLAVPENFDFKDFTAKIEDFFTKLHAEKLYHRDAHWGNILIENETGFPCIIDFGGSIEMTLDCEDPYRQTSFNGETVIFTPDENRLREELRVKLRRFLFEKYGNIHNL